MGQEAARPVRPHTSRIALPRGPDRLLRRWLGGFWSTALCASLWGCGWWFTDSIRASHAAGASRPRVAAVLRFHPLVHGADESLGRSGLADPATIGCEDGLELLGVAMVYPVTVASASAAAHEPFPDATNAPGLASAVGADVAIVGSVNIFELDAHVDVQLVRAATGAIEATAHVEGNKDLRVLGRDACVALLSPDDRRNRL